MSKGFSFSRGLQPSFQVDSQKSQVLWCQWGTWVCQEMVHLKPGAEIAKKFSGNAQPVGWAKQSDAEANCAEALCWPTIGISKFFFFGTYLSLYFMAYMALPVFYHDSMSGEVLPCLLDMPFISKFLHKGLFMQGRSTFISIIGSSLTITCLSLLTTLIPLGISWSCP